MRASRLSLGERAVNSQDERSKSPIPRNPLSNSEGEGSSCGSTFAGGSYTSGTDLIESDFWGTEYSHELASSRGSSVQAVGCSRFHLGSKVPYQQCESPGAQTLAELKHEAQRDKTEKQSKKSSKSKRKIPH